MIFNLTFIQKIFILGKCIMENVQEKRRAIAICPAGVVIHGEGSVKECLQQYKAVDVVDALKHEKNMFNDKAEYFKKWTKHIRPFKRDLPEVLQFGRKSPTNYQTLIQEMTNTSYASYWEKDIGKKRDVNPLHFSVDTPLHTITFGIPSKMGDTVKDCLQYWILEEPSPYDKFFAKRKLPVRPGGLKTSRKANTYDPRGIWLNCIMHPGVKELIIADSIQATYQEEYCHKLEKPLIIPKP